MEMKRSENQGPENWPQFLRDMQDPQIAAILADDPLTHINRATARKNGEQSAEDLKDRVMAKRKELEDFRSFTCGKWLSERMGEFFPAGLRERTIANGPKEANNLGWFWGSESKPMFQQMETDLVPKLYPSTKCLLGFQETKKRFIWFGQRIAVGQPTIKAQQLFIWNESED